MQNRHLVIALCGAGVVLAGGMAGIAWLAMKVLPAQIGGVGEPPNLDRQVSKYRSMGLPWVAADLERLYSPKGSNGSQLILDAVSTVQDIDPAVFYAEALTLIDKGKSKEFDAKIAPYRHAMELAMRATKCDCIVFHRDWEVEEFVLRPEQEAMKPLVALLCAEGVREAAAGERRRNIEHLAAADLLSSALASDPGFMPLVGHLGCEAYIDSALGESISYFWEDAEQLGKLREIAERERPPGRFIRYLKAHSYGQIVFCRNATVFHDLNVGSEQQVTQTLTGKEVLHEGLPGTPEERALLSTYLDSAIQTMALAERFEHQPRMFRDSLLRYREALSSDRNAMELKRLYMLPDDAEELRMTMAAYDAKRSLNQLAIRTAQFRLKHGRHIKSLSELGNIPADPFRPEQPLLARFQGKMATYYTVGSNGVDDGGMVDEEGDKAALDLGFEIDLSS